MTGGHETPDARPTPSETPGIRVAAVSDWIYANVDQACPPLKFSLIAGGRSNLTYCVTDGAGQRWVLRRPPTGGLLQTAHDVDREWRFLSALAPTSVPVPRPVARCSDASVTGAQFYLAEYCDGLVLSDSAAGNAMPALSRAVVADVTVDILADLHRIPAQSVGIDSYRRPGSYLLRQVRRWREQVSRSALAGFGLFDEVYERLAMSPPRELSAIVHGDFRPGNLLYTQDGHVRAVLDWELATIGDPLADLGWLLASWWQEGDTVRPITDGPTMSGGYPPRDVLIGRYGEATGFDMSRLSYYLAFARWRSACIAAGIYTRHLDRHAGASSDIGMYTPQFVKEQLLAALDG
jgi:aminoglycoside phosphotransferase (APT) family kinase protein